MGKFAGEIASLPGKPEWLKQGEIMRLMRGASSHQEVPRNITAAKSDKYLCWKRGVVWTGGCASSPGCQTPSGAWVVTAINSFVTWSPAAQSALQLPPSCHSISAGCWSLPPELLHCFIHWVTGMSSHPDHNAEERKWERSSFHRNFLGCFSISIWLLISLKQPKEGTVFWVYFLFSLADLVHLDQWSWVSKSFRNLHSKWVGPWNGFIWYTEGCAWALVRGLAGGSLFGSCSACLAVSHLHGSRATIPTRFPSCCRALIPQEQMQAQEIRWVHGAVTWTLLCGCISASTVNCKLWWQVSSVSHLYHYTVRVK